MKASLRLYGGAALALIVPTLAWAQQNILDPRTMAPFVPTPPEVVERMLKLADVKGTDTVYDLGSGDGRIIITAAQQFGARAVGIELDSVLAEKAEKRIRELNVQNKAKVLRGNLFDADLSQASVVTLYLLTSTNELLRPKFEKTLKPGTRVVSHDFQIKGWTPISTEVFRGDGREHKIFLYEVGKHGGE
jgi:hypothetical protein